MLRSIDRVGVVGSGTMASGIAEVFAKAGFAVTLVARSADAQARAHAAISKSLEKAVQRGKLEEADRAATLDRLAVSTRLDDLATADLVIEAVVEELDVKQALFENLDEICRPGAILATTTSSLPVVECAVATKRPADVVGLHFFNPAPVMRLVEVVHTVSTAPEVVASVKAVVERLGKHPVECGDRSGFIVNALLFPYLNDAVKMLEAHYAGVEDIDTAMKTGCGYPDGPVRAARCGRPGRVARHPAPALPGVPGARFRAGSVARAAGHRGLPRPQERPRLPRLHLSPEPGSAGDPPGVDVDGALGQLVGG